MIEATVRFSSSAETETDPGALSYHVLRGNILQSLFRFGESAQAYEAALALKPGVKNVACCNG